MIKSILGYLFVVMTAVYSLGYWRAALDGGLLVGLLFLWSGFAIGCLIGYYKYPEVWK